MATSSIICAAGYRISDYGSTAISIPNNSATNVASITVPAGRWFVSAWANFDTTNTTGYRALTVGDSATATTGVTDAARGMYAPSSGGCRRVLSFILNTSGRALYLNLTQTSGAARNANAYGIVAVKIR